MLQNNTGLFSGLMSSVGMMQKRRRRDAALRHLLSIDSQVLLDCGLTQSDVLWRLYPPQTPKAKVSGGRGVVGLATSRTA